jgi:hypothetical protein
MSSLCVYRLHARTHSRRRRVISAVAVADVISACSQTVNPCGARLSQRVGRATVAAFLQVRRVERRGRLHANPRGRDVSIRRLDVERREPVAHGCRDAASRETLELWMFPERRGQIAEHRIGVAGDGHEITETFPLDKAQEAHDGMISNKARFRVALTTGD